MKKIYRFAAALLITALLAINHIMVFADFALTDISGTWYEQTALNAVEKGWVKGYPDGTFRGSSSITTAEFISLVNSVFNITLSENVSNPFVDINPEDWFYQDILISYSNGFIPFSHFHQLNQHNICSICNKFNPANDIKPNEPISRQDAIVILSRLNGVEYTGEIEIVPRDYVSVSAYAQPAVKELYCMRIARGDENKNIHPFDNITRAEALALVERTYNFLNGIEEEYKDPIFEIENDFSGDPALYLVDTEGFQGYNFAISFEAPKELNKYQGTSPLYDYVYNKDLLNEPINKLIDLNHIKNGKLMLFYVNPWKYTYGYKGYIPTVGEKITIKITVTNEQKSFSKDYYIDYIVE